MTFDYDSLNPGIRETVRFLRERGYQTCDSGDGVTAEFECDPGFPYVHMVCAPDDLVEVANRLYALMRPFVDFERECSTAEEQWAAPTIEASYHPLGGNAIVSLMNVADKDWTRP